MRCGDGVHVIGSGLEHASCLARRLTLLSKDDRDRIVRNGVSRRRSLQSLCLIYGGLPVSQISWEISNIGRGDHLQRPTHYTPGPGDL